MLSAEAAITKYHRLRGQGFIFSQLKDGKSKMKGPADLIFGNSSLLGL